MEGARSETAEARNEAVGLLSGVPRSPLRAHAEQVARRARLQLTSGRADASPGERADRFGLTQREADVLRLLAEARTNREIGEALFISPKTASVHVSCESSGCAAGLIRRASPRGRRPTSGRSDEPIAAHAFDNLYWPTASEPTTGLSKSPGPRDGRPGRSRSSSPTGP